jgi:hypothetical protein
LDLTEGGNEPLLEVHEHNSAFDSGDDYISLKDKFEAEKLEGKGVRLPMSEDSDSFLTVSKPKLSGVLEDKESLTACTEYERKFDSRHRSGIVQHPTPKDMRNKSDSMFLQVFSAMTDNYIQEEIEAEQRGSSNS